jgi:hypothetical protein
MRAVAVGLAMAAMLPASIYFGRLTSWRANGYAGLDGGETAVVALLAQGASGTHPTRLTVGYDASGRAPGESVPDIYHQPGAWIDYLLVSRYDIQNDRSLDGPLSDEDEYRIRDTTIGGDGRPISASAAPEWVGFRLVAEFGPLEVYKRLATQP